MPELIRIYKENPSVLLICNSHKTHNKMIIFESPNSVIRMIDQNLVII